MPAPPGTIPINGEFAPSAGRNTNAIADSDDIRGCPKQVADIAARNAISQDDAKLGMLCTVQDDGMGAVATYILNAMPPSVGANWGLFSSGGTGSGVTMLTTPNNTVVLSASSGPVTIDVDQATTVTDVASATGAVGTSAKSAREDHTHACIYGTVANTVCEGNDSRLSDSRVPTGAAGGNLGGTYPNPSVTTDGTLSNSGSNIGVLQANATPVAVGVSSGAVGTSLRSAKQDHQHPVTYGTAANTVCQGNDSRLSDARTPTAHATTHVTGGSDVIPNAVASGNAGLMSGTDKNKLDLYPAVSGLTTGQSLRATGAATAAFGAVDLANANAVTGQLPNANINFSSTVDFSTQQVQGGRIGLTAVSGTTSVSSTAGLIYMVDTSAARTLNLPQPSAVGSGFYFAVFDKIGTSSANPITLHRFGSEKIQGTAADATLSAGFGYWLVWTDGTDWWLSGPQ